MPLSARLSAVCSAAPERGDIILGWLTRIVVVFAIAGIALFDAISVATTAISLTDQGGLAAREASEVWQETGNLQEAYNAASAFALEANPQNTVDTKSFVIDEDNTVHLTVGREATTFILYRWGKTASWAQLEREAAGRSVV